MAGPTPNRTRRVFFVGAGLSSAAGLPNTPSLITGVLELAKRKTTWGITASLPQRLEEAFRFFYPDAELPGFQPNVVDFFSTLRTFIDIGTQFPGTGLEDPAGLFRLLRLAIAHLLVDETRGIDAQRLLQHEYIQDMVQAGNIIITSNWDPLIERFAQLADVPLRLSGEELQSGVLLLKLHGSVDWTLREHGKRAFTTDNYASLRERLFHPGRPYRLAVPKRPDDIIRVRALESWTQAWRLIKSSTSEPHIVTMVRGKAGDLGPLEAVWRDAYAALSRAASLEIVGYSMPTDDTEIRTLLRAGIRRGGQNPEVSVRNPSPEVHDRVRSLLGRDAGGSYLPINSI